MRQLLVSMNLLIAAMLLAGCGQILDGKSKGEDAVKAFHDSYNAGKFADIAAMAGPDITGTTSPGQFEAMLAGVKEQLGPVQSSKQKSFNVNIKDGVSQVDFMYDTQYANGQRNEEFVWKITDKKAELAGWYITDPNAPQDVAPAAAEAEPAE